MASRRARYRGAIVRWASSPGSWAASRSRSRVEREEKDERISVESIAITINEGVTRETDVPNYRTLKAEIRPIERRNGKISNV